jgi:tRNA-2-methylthio-N6-dimethylallyladenosine synthase
VSIAVPKKLFIRSFGCQMNEYDSEKMADVLGASGDYLATDRAEDADVILYNTCSVRENAQERVFHDLGRVRELKLAKPELLIGVGGCVASQEGAGIVARAPYVDLVFGPQTLHRLPQLIAARLRSGQPQVDISFPEIEKFDALPPASVKGSSALVSIMEGCSKYCTFCVVPYTRGEEVSRPLEDVLVEVAGLAQSGVKEVTLLGQNVNAYRGAILDGDNADAGGAATADFAMLLEYVDEIPGIELIRYSTSHPKEFTQRLIDAYGTIPALADHVHLPVQAGSDRILAAMKRGYTALEYKSIVRRLRAVRPHITLSSDFIVGFPGETDADFDATMRLVDDVGFDFAYSFVYSPRPGTPAASLRDETPPEVKAARLQRLQSSIDARTQQLGVRMVGSRQRVLVAGSSPKNAAELSGRTSNNCVVNFAGDAALVGRFVEVNIAAAHPRSLRGELADATALAC